MTVTLKPEQWNVVMDYWYDRNRLIYGEINRKVWKTSTNHDETESIYLSPHMAMKTHEALFSLNSNGRPHDYRTI